MADKRNLRERMGIPTGEQTRRLGLAAAFGGTDNAATIMDKLEAIEQRLSSIEATLGRLESHQTPQP